MTLPAGFGVNLVAAIGTNVPRWIDQLAALWEAQAFLAAAPGRFSAA